MVDESADSEQVTESESDDGDSGTGTPHVELSMFQLGVTVRGSHDDDLDDVSETARDLMDYLVEKSLELEERPDDRGLG